MSELKAKLNNEIARFVSTLEDKELTHAFLDFSNKLMRETDENLQPKVNLLSTTSGHKLIVAEPMEAKKELERLFDVLKTKSVTDLSSSMHIDKHKLNILVTWIEGAY